MDRRRFLGGVSAAVLAAQFASQARAQGAKKGVMMFYRIGPSSSELYIANADGSNERKLLQKSVFDYHAAFSADGQWLVFTSERDGLGEADIYSARIDGSDIRRLTTDPAVDDRGAISPDGSMLAFVSTRGEHRANIWTLNIKSGQLRNLTGGRDAQGDPSKPDGFFRPAWSPDGQWLAFSSDRNTDWRGHDSGVGWEHTQELSIYVVRIDGTGFRKVASRPDFCLGSPQWSPDGKRIVFYETMVEDTWKARRPESVAAAVGQIVSADVATGQRVAHTSGPGLKLFPQYLGAEEIAYQIKGGPDEGLYYTSGRPALKRVLRSPTWSRDGKQVIYEKVAFRPEWAQNTPFFSWDPDYDYRATDSFPALSPDHRLAVSEQTGDGSLILMKADGTDPQRIVRPGPHGERTYQPSWSPDGQWIAYGFGHWFYHRDTAKNLIMRVHPDGSGAEALTDGKENAGFPSYSADGKFIVYRVWGEPNGLRVLNVQDRSIRVLTNDEDNMPGWSPDGSRIVFTRKMGGANYDVFTIRPDGSDLRKLTDSGANDGHAVWTADGRIFYTSGMYGFKDEAALYDNTFQPYGGVFIMNADGSNKRLLTDSPWEDALPVYVPAKYLSPK